MSADDGRQSASGTGSFNRVSASSDYDRQEADACITISERLSVKTSYGKSSGNVNIDIIRNPGDYHTFYEFKLPKSDYIKDFCLLTLNFKRGLKILNFCQIARLVLHGIIMKKKGY